MPLPILLPGENFINVAWKDFVPASITALMRTLYLEILLPLVNYIIFKSTFICWDSILYY